MSYVAATLQIVADEESPRGYVLYSGNERVDDKYLDLALRSCVGGTLTFEVTNGVCKERSLIRLILSRAFAAEGTLGNI